MTGGKDRRPGDGDRQRYAAVLDAARAQGRIDDAELSRRSFAVRYAQTMGELDAVIDDLPGPDGPGHERKAPAVIVAVAAIVIAVVLGVVAANSGDGHDEPEAGEPVGAVEAPPVADAEDAPIAMYSVAELTRMWDALAALPVSGMQRMYLHEEWAGLEIQTAPGALTYDELEYDGTLGPAEPGGQVTGEDPEAVFFPLDDVDPAIVAACAARAAEVAQRPDRAVELIVISRDVFYGDTVTINVHLETDAYGVGAVVTWDATGQHLLDDGIDQ